MSNGAPQTRLPKLLDPRKLAHSEAEMAGIVPEDQLPRLREVSSSGQASDLFADLRFFVDEQGRRRLQGSVSTAVKLVCQRCLEAFEFGVSGEVDLTIVSDEAKASELPRQLDPWIVAQEQADLHAALEEEVLLLLPTAPVHDYACVDPEDLSRGEHTSNEPNSRENPFNVLAELKPALKDKK